MSSSSLFAAPGDLTLRRFLLSRLSGRPRRESEGLPDEDGEDKEDEEDNLPGKAAVGAIRDTDGASSSVSSAA